MKFVVNWHYCVCYISVSQTLPSAEAIKYSSVIHHSTQNHLLLCVSVPVCARASPAFILCSINLYVFPLYILRFRPLKWEGGRADVLIRMAATKPNLICCSRIREFPIVLNIMRSDCFLCWKDVHAF
jgi:hypothetical protein